MHTTTQPLDIAQLTWMFIVVSAIMIVVGLPMAMNVIKPNRLYGVRTPRTLSDERVWYLANPYAGKRLVLVGIITIILAAVLRLTNVSPETYLLLCTISFLGGLLLMAAMTLLYIKRIP